MGYSKAIMQRFRIKEALLPFLSYILPLIIRWIKGCKRCLQGKKRRKKIVSLLLQPNQYLLVYSLGIKTRSTSLLLILESAFARLLCCFPISLFSIKCLHFPFSENCFWKIMTQPKCFRKLKIKVFGVFLLNQMGHYGASCPSMVDPCSPSLPSIPHFSAIHRLVKLDRFLVKKLNNPGLAVCPCGISLITGHQLRFGALMNTVWAWWFRQFSIHLIGHLSRQEFITWATVTLWKTTAFLKSSYTISRQLLILLLVVCPVFPCDGGHRGF